MVSQRHRGVATAKQLQRAWQLLWFPERHKREAQRQGDGRPKEKAPGLKADDDVQLVAGIALHQQVAARLVGQRVKQQRRDVLELDARLGPVWNDADAGPHPRKAGICSGCCCHDFCTAWLRTPASGAELPSRCWI